MPVTDNAQRAAVVALLAKAGPALAANTTYLAIASPTNAQALAQTRALTRQVNAMMKLVAGMYGTHGLLDVGTDT